MVMQKQTGETETTKNKQNVKRVTLIVIIFKDMHLVINHQQLNAQFNTSKQDTSPLCDG